MQAQATETISNNVLKYCEMLCEALKDNYREYSIRGHKRAAANYTDYPDYHQKAIDELKQGNLPIDYVIETGKKYHKIIFVDGGSGRSAHAFVDKKTGEMYKSATWKSPAKGVRYDLRLIEDREQVLANCDWSGGYLYAR